MAQETAPPIPPSPDAATPKPRRGPPRGRIAAFALFVLALVAILVYYLHRSAHWETTDDAFVESHVIPISPLVNGHVWKLHVTDNQPVTSGTLLLEIDPRDYAARTAQQKALLHAAEAREAAARGNLELVRATSSAGVDVTTSGVDVSKQAVETARSALEAARSQERQAQAQLQSAEADIEKAEAEMRADQAEAERAEKDLVRYAQLVKDEVMSQQQYDFAAATAKEAVARLEAARKAVQSSKAKGNENEAALETARERARQIESQLKESQSRVGEATGRFMAADTAPAQIAVAEAQLGVARADVEQTKAALAQAELNLSRTQLYAPEDGWITRRTVEEGAYVQPGQPLLALVTSEVWVLANFKETQLTNMRPGQSARIKVDAFPGKWLAGRVDSIQSGTGSRFSLLPPENATGNFVKVVQRVPVKILFDELPPPPQRLVPGMSVVPEVRVK